MSSLSDICTPWSDCSKANLGGFSFSDNLVLLLEHVGHNSSGALGVNNNGQRSEFRGSSRAASVHYQCTTLGAVFWGTWGAPLAHLGNCLGKFGAFVRDTWALALYNILRHILIHRMCKLQMKHLAQIRLQKHFRGPDEVLVQFIIPISENFMSYNVTLRGLKHIVA